MRVLIADDDLSARLLLKRWLQQHGSFDVADEAVDGVEAVDAATRLRPELAVLDLAMPRMDGLEAAAEIRGLLPDTRIVVQSAFSAERMAQKAIDAGADVYVEKVAESAHLLAVLEGLFPGLDAGTPSTLPVPRSAELPTSADALLLDALDVGVLQVDRTGRVTEANFAATLALGVPTSHLVGTSLSGLLAGARREDGREVGAKTDPVSAALASGSPQSGSVLALTKPNGDASWLSVNVRPILDHQSTRAAGAVVVVSDLTEERRLRQALEEAEAQVYRGATAEMLEAAVISSPVGAVLLDRTARLVIANPVADRLLGGSPLLSGASPYPRSLQRAATREPLSAEELPFRAACEGVGFDDLELFVADADGVGGTYVKLSGRPVLDSAGHPAGAVISVIDDSAAKRAEQALAATHAELRRSNTELASFASTCSHDLSQPLHMIYGFAQLLQMRDLEDDQARDYVERIVAGSERMRTLIQDLLTYSQLTSHARPFEPVALAPVVAEVVELYQQEIADHGARITVEELPTVLADRTQMSQLFQNLLGNALTYVAQDVPPVIEVTSARAQHEWQVTVTDNGIGIDPENRQRAFAMFERLVKPEDYPGTGIGLAVCAKIVDRHGGRIWIEENPDGGTRLCFTLPDRPGPQAEA